MTTRNGDDRTSVSLNLKSGAGTIRTRSRGTPAAPPPAPFASRNIRISESVSQQLRDGVPMLLDSLDIPHEEIVSVSVPELVFQVEADGRPYQVSYNADRGTLTTRATDAEREPLPWRSFLTRLHTAHGYPDDLTPRWAWAVGVDAMFVSMCFWGVSGILMWWQLKATRLVGAGTLVASAVVAVLMATSMHQEMMRVVPAVRGEAAQAAPSGRAATSARPQGEGETEGTPSAD